ncbi:MAG: GTP-binding protein [Firmicutes bacterium]|nr:GTP-binding protein [Bacillota bacterium]
MEGKQLTIGILAHVDAGKTTLSESILYLTGAVRKLGRVDHGDAFLDMNRIERERGITVFSKTARFSLGDVDVTLLDTPGHVDFSGEMERVLSVLDYGILVISGADGVQGHTMTLWQLLKLYGIPTFVFVNKMDQPGTERPRIMEELRRSLGDGFVAIGEKKGAMDMPVFENEEELALCSEELMESYLETGSIPVAAVKRGIADCRVFPVSFGSALKMEGVEEFLAVVSAYTTISAYPSEFGARVFKITRDKQGNRLTHMKVTGGSLRSKMVLQGGLEGADLWEEKVEQIRLYSGDSFQMVQEVEAGTVCVVTGLTKTYAGQGLGITGDLGQPALEPALTYQVILPEGAEPVTSLQKLRLLEEENPLLRVVWKEALKEIHVQVMGDLELEILQRTIEERFDLAVSFGQGSLIYKETISKPVIGIGHFEPLRHYAEVHLLLEPGAPGSGLVFDTVCSEDKLARNWQRLILTHLAEKAHVGALIGANITDMKITLLAGRAHVKHTEGGDFRQATYRAVRQGLKKAAAAGHGVLLEPFYRFRLEAPAENVGRAMADMQRLSASCELEAGGRAELVTLVGEGPVSTLGGYQRDVAAYTKGQGRFLTTMAGYMSCHDQEAVIDQRGYLAEEDLENPTGSVFCAHGGAVHVDWMQVDEMAHVESGYRLDSPKEGILATDEGNSRSREGFADEKELEAIFLRTYGKSKRDEALRRAHQSQATRTTAQPENFPTLNRKADHGAASYFIVDGYNVIFAWEELKELASINLDGAREAFLEVMANYQGYRNVGILVVFDGYRVPANPGSRSRYGKVDVVFTKEAETADQYIEKMTYELAKTYKITVVTSDRMVQMAAFGDGAARVSAREFYREVMSVSEEIRTRLKKQILSKNRPFEGKL